MSEGQDGSIEVCPGPVDPAHCKGLLVSQGSWVWSHLVANYDQSQTPEAIESLRDMARRFAIEAERIDIDCTPMVIAIDELRLARAGAVRTEEFRASLDAVLVVV